jgi:branched-chain amino acid transport system permease protein
MTELVQNLIDGLGRGGIYALLALGVAVVFGVMHLLNFAHGELITVSGYAAYAAFSNGWSWYLVAPLIVAVSVVANLLIERIAFSRVRGSSEFTQLLTSFGIHFLVAAIFLMYVGARVQTFAEPGWIADTFMIGPIRVEVFDTVVIIVTIVTLFLTAAVLQRTMFGLSIRAAAADFDAARLMGVNSDRVIRGAFALSGALAGIAGIFWLMRAGHTSPTSGINPMLSGVLAALIGGLGSLKGAVIGSLVIGMVDTYGQVIAPEFARVTIYALMAAVLLVRPHGLFPVSQAH